MRGVPRQEQGIEDVPLCPRQRRAQLQPLQDVGIRGARLQVTHRLPEPVQTMKMSPEISAGVLPPPRPGGCPPYPGIWGFSRGEAPAAAAGMKENSGCVCVPAGAQPAAIPARNGLDRAGNPAQPQGPATGGINSNPPHPDPPPSLRAPAGAGTHWGCSALDRRAPRIRTAWGERRWRILGKGREGKKGFGMQGMGSEPAAAPRPGAGTPGCCSSPWATREGQKPSQPLSGVGTLRWVCPRWPGAGFGSRAWS